MLQVCLLLSSLRFHTNLSQPFFSMGLTSDQVRRCGLEKLILPMEGNAATFPLVLHVQLSGIILESDVNQRASKHIISFFS